MIGQSVLNGFFDRAEIDRKEEAIRAEIKARVPFEDLDCVSNIKLVSITLKDSDKFKSLISQVYLLTLLKKCQYRSVWCFARLLPEMKKAQPENFRFKIDRVQIFCINVISYG